MKTQIRFKEKEHKDKLDEVDFLLIHKKQILKDEEKKNKALKEKYNSVFAKAEGMSKDELETKKGDEENENKQPNIQTADESKMTQNLLGKQKTDENIKQKQNPSKSKKKTKVNSSKKIVNGKKKFKK